MIAVSLELTQQLIGFRRGAKQIIRFKDLH